MAAATRISRPRISGIEAGTITTLSVTDLHRLATVLGLEASVRLYAGGTPIRDAAHSGKLATSLAQVHRPLVARVEVPLPSNPDRWERLRANLDAAGVEYALESGTSIYFRDPDGARLEMIADPLGEMYGTQVL